MAIERIVRVPLREVWKHEAHDFTTWLETNLDVLNDLLPFGLDPETVRRESAAGAFFVDLVAEDENGDTVIIENQLERSNHDHLGKVLTYLAAFEASKAIWIVGEARPEHIRAVAWLNDSSSASVYLMKIEAVRIGNSAPAPLLSLVVGPSESSPDVAVAKQEKTVRHSARRQFFNQLIPVSNQHVQSHSGRTGTDGPYLGGSSGYAGISPIYGVTQHATTAIIWIDRGNNHEAWNDAVFQHLLEHRSDIESAMGQSIEWQAKPGNRSRKLMVSIAHGGWTDETRWPAAIEATVDVMARLQAAVKPHLNGASAAAASAVSHPTEDTDG